MRKQWAEEREDMTERFLQQLRDDPLHEGEVAPEESTMWDMYRKDMDDIQDYQ